MYIYYTDNYIGGREESRRLLEKALAVHIGDEERAKTLTGALKKGEHGKPYIEGFSCFSISHTGSIWAVLVADRECGESGECGLDIQLGRKCDIRAVSERWFATEDAAIIAQKLDKDPADEQKANDEFFRIWTRREALIKAVGGTVCDTSMPAVSSDHIAVDGKSYTVNDIRIPETADLYAAVCIYNRGTAAEQDLVIFVKI